MKAQVYEFGCWFMHDMFKLTQNGKQAKYFFAKNEKYLPLQAQSSSYFCIYLHIYLPITRKPSKRCNELA